MGEPHVAFKLFPLPGKCFVIRHSQLDQMCESLKQSSMCRGSLLSTLDLFYFAGACLLCPFHGKFLSADKSVQCSEGVNDLWTGPAADVGSMEVNRDEVCSIQARAYMTDTANVP